LRRFSLTSYVLRLTPMAEPYTSYFGFENLEVYQLGLEFIAEIYQLTKKVS